MFFSHAGIESSCSWSVNIMVGHKDGVARYKSWKKQETYNRHRVPCSGSGLGILVEVLLGLITRLLLGWIKIAPPLMTDGMSLVSWSSEAIK
jgi:hypothetical protein